MKNPIPSALLIPFLVIFLLSGNQAEATIQQKEQDFIMQYDEPADDWVEALPIGNGRLGAIIFGNTAKEELQLNEETVRAGEPGNNINPETGEPIPEIRRLLNEGMYAKAKEYANDLNFRQVYLYDLNTEPGQSYILTSAETDEN